MATKFSDLLGETLLQASKSDKKDGSYQQVSTNQLDNKVVGLYFSAHWCGPCRAFTPLLVEHYMKLPAEVCDRLEIVFISLDNDEAGFNDYFRTMPWKALPYTDRTRATQLGQKFEIEGIPTLVILSPDGNILSRDGTADVRKKGGEALQLWSQGTLKGSEDHKWIGVFCQGCQMDPLIGQRFSCSTCNNYDLCAACVKKGHAHELKLVPQTLSTIGSLVWKGINLHS